MRIVRYIALAIDWIVAVTAGALAFLLWFLAVVFRYTPAVDMLSKLNLSGWDTSAIVLGSLGLLVLNVVVIIDLVVKVCCPSYLRLETPAGRLSVSVRALRDALRRSALAIDGVVAARIRVSTPSRAGRPVIARAYITLKGGISYRDVSHNIISAMEYKFADIVGAGLPLECRIYWEKIRLEPSPETPARQAPQYEPLRPQFPVDEEDSDSA